MERRDKKWVNWSMEETLLLKLGGKGYIEFKTALEKLEKSEWRGLFLLLLEAPFLPAKEEVCFLLKLLGNVVH